MVEVIALLISWLLTAYMWHKNRAKFKKRIFFDKVNFSLNEIIDSELQMRTLDERSADDVWQSKVAVAEIEHSAKQTTEEDPFLVIEDEGDLNFLKRAALNNLSKQFANSFVARAIGLPVHTKEFVFGITCEKYPLIRKQKIRVMVIAREILEQYFLPESDVFVDASGKQTREDRIRTLRKMGEIYTTEGVGNSSRLGIIELGIPG